MIKQRREELGGGRERETRTAESGAIESWARSRLEQSSPAKQERRAHGSLLFSSRSLSPVCPRRARPRAVLLWVFEIYRETRLNHWKREFGPGFVDGVARRIFKLDASCLLRRHLSRPSRFGQSPSRLIRSVEFADWSIRLIGRCDWPISSS